MKPIYLSLAALAAALPLPALAQDAPAAPFTVSGSIALVSDYRFRGVSQSDEELAVQGGLTLTHESGFYVATWASNLSGWGTFGGSNTELDLVGGFKTEVSPGVNVDVGLTWYMYPGGASETDFAEPYIKISTTFGPISWLGGVAYAPKQQALGKWYNSGASYATGIPDNPGKKNDNFYVWGDISSAIPNTPITLKAHLGYSEGNSGLGPNGTSVAPTGEYLDWMVGADWAAFGPVVLGVAYTDTNIKLKEAKYLYPNFSNTKDGTRIAGPQVVFSVSAAF
ncbi:TorF family putative porin [Sphingomonas sp. ID0503]|uniref:TorF family putative porin n=1 Tax=Sphingomonas sp. ID0503 TaxID=3399691 RepID=UPI003AFA6F54